MDARPRRGVGGAANRGRVGARGGARIRGGIGDAAQPRVRERRADLDAGRLDGTVARWVGDACGGATRSRSGASGRFGTTRLWGKLGTRLHFDSLCETNRS